MQMRSRLLSTLIFQASRPGNLPSLFPLILLPPWVSFLTLYFPCQRAFSDPILSCKHFLVCFFSTYLLNESLTHVMVYALAYCLPPHQPLSFLKAEMSQTDSPFCLQEGAQVHFRWWGPPSICRVHYLPQEITGLKHSGYFYCLYRPHHFESTPLKRSFQHLMRELFSKTRIFKDKTKPVGPTFHFTEERTQFRRNWETHPRSFDALQWQEKVQNLGFWQPSGCSSLYTLLLCLQSYIFQPKASTVA